MQIFHIVLWSLANNKNNHNNTGVTQASKHGRIYHNNCSKFTQKNLLSSSAENTKKPNTKTKTQRHLPLRRVVSLSEDSIKDNFNWDQHSPTQKFKKTHYYYRPLLLIHKEAWTPKNQTQTGFFEFFQSSGKIFWKNIYQREYFPLPIIVFDWNFQPIRVYICMDMYIIYIYTLFKNWKLDIVVCINMNNFLNLILEWRGYSFNPVFTVY